MRSTLSVAALALSLAASVNAQACTEDFSATNAYAGGANTDSFEVECRPRYTPSGNPATCDSGSWSDVTCVPNPCDSNYITKNGVAGGAGTKSGDSHIVVCDNNYAPVGPTSDGAVLCTAERWAYDGTAYVQRTTCQKKIGDGTFDVCDTGDINPSALAWSGIANGQLTKGPYKGVPASEINYWNVGQLAASVTTATFSGNFNDGSEPDDDYAATTDSETCVKTLKSTNWPKTRITIDRMDIEKVPGTTFFLVKDKDDVGVSFAESAIAEIAHTKFPLTFHWKAAEATAGKKGWSVSFAPVPCPAGEYVGEEGKCTPMYCEIKTASEWMALGLKVGNFNEEKNHNNADGVATSYATVAFVNASATTSCGAGLPFVITCLENYGDFAVVGECTTTTTTTTTTTVAPSSSSVPSPSGNATTAAEQEKRDAEKAAAETKERELILIIVGVLVFFLLLCCFLFFCCFKKNKKNKVAAGKNVEMKGANP